MTNPWESFIQISSGKPLAWLLFASTIAVTPAMAQKSGKQLFHSVDNPIVIKPGVQEFRVGNDEDGEESEIPPPPLPSREETPETPESRAGTMEPLPEPEPAMPAPAPAPASSRPIRVRPSIPGRTDPPLEETRKVTLPARPREEALFKTTTTPAPSPVPPPRVTAPDLPPAARYPAPELPSSPPAPSRFPMTELPKSLEPARTLPPEAGNTPAVAASLHLLREEAHFIAQQGLPHRFGLNHPKYGGLDSSGAVQFVLSQIGLKEVPRTTVALHDWLRDYGLLHEFQGRPSVATIVDALVPGNLLFWGDPYTGRIHHVMIYLGFDGRKRQHYAFGTRGGLERGLNDNEVDVFELRLDREKLIATGNVPGLRME